jgi:hypothetical protein
MSDMYFTAITCKACMQYNTHGIQDQLARLFRTRWHTWLMLNANSQGSNAKHALVRRVHCQLSRTPFVPYHGQAPGCGSLAVWQSSGCVHVSLHLPATVSQPSSCNCIATIFLQLYRNHLPATVSTCYARLDISVKACLFHADMYAKHTHTHMCMESNVQDMQEETRAECNPTCTTARQVLQLSTGGCVWGRRCAVDLMVYVRCLCARHVVLSYLGCRYEIV